MLKTLKIVSFVCIAAAIMGVLFVLFFGLRADSDSEQALSEASIIETLRKDLQTGIQKTDTVSPLISEAKAFALRINPPPPPPPPRPPRPAETRPVQTAQDVVSSNRTFSGKFDLLATAQYPMYPQKSLALLDVIPDGQKWFRQGESVGRFKIHEVKEGSIVLYQDDKFSSELFVPAPVLSSPSLLKSDQNNPVSTKGPSSIMGQLPGGHTENTVSSAAADGEILPEGEAPSPTRTSIPAGRVRFSRPSPLPNREAGSPEPEVVISPPQIPEPEPTPEERKASIDESIAGIKQIMSETRQGTDADREEENKAWVDLLKVLEEEKKSIEATGGK